MKRNFKTLVLLTATLVLVIGSLPALAGKDNKGSGAPSGQHYTLNILGKDWGDSKDEINCADWDVSKGHRIFVQLGEQGAQAAKRTKIMLYSCEELDYGEGCMDFQVLDCDGTDGEASFMLPDPNGGEPNSTAYSVYVRALGKPGGIADVNVCATYDDPADPCGPAVWCGETITLWRTKGQEKKAATQSNAKSGSQKFINVSKELLTICVNVYDPKTGTYSLERLYIFDEYFEGELWNYDNKGLRHAQVRFYPVPSEYSTEEWSCK